MTYVVVLILLIVSISHYINFGVVLKKALLTSSLYYPNVGGVENSLAAINKCLVAEGWHVDIVVSDNDQASPEPLPSESISAEGNVYRYKHKSVFGPVTQAIRARRLIKTINPKLDYDLVIARSSVGVLASKLLGMGNVNFILPAISAYLNKASLHGSMRSKIGYYLNSYAQKTAISVASQNYVFSNEMVRQVDKFTNGKVNPNLISPGLDASRFKKPDSFDKGNERQQIGVDENDIVLLCLGRFSPVKGFEYVIESLVHLDNKYQLLLVGEGPEEKKYHKLAKDLNLENRVKIFNKTDFPEKYYWLSDIFVLSSTYESFGQVLLEATASGLPVAAFNKKSGVNTATEEIYTYNPELVRFASEVSGKALSVAAAEAYQAKTCFQEDFEHSRQGFLSQYSWNSMVEVLYGSKI